MTTIKETSGQLKPMSWLEFISDNDRPLHDLWEWSVNAREIGQRFDTAVEGDDFMDKTWIMNAIAKHKIDVSSFYTNRTLTHYFNKRFGKMHREGLEDLAVVPTTMKAMTQAQQARRYVNPPFAVTPDEVDWQANCVLVCNHVIAVLNQMKADLAGRIRKEERIARNFAFGTHDKQGKPLRLTNAQVNKMLGFDLREKERWMRTSDDGTWEDDMGNTWDEDDHNGMLPWEECGDTEEEEDSCDGGAQVPEPQRVLAISAPAPGSGK